MKKLGLKAAGNNVLLRKRAVVFDVGGVFTQTCSFVGRRKWETRLGLAEGALSRIVLQSNDAQLATLGYISEDERWQRLAATFHLKSAELDELTIDFWSDTKVNHDLVEFAGFLRSKCRVGLLSNSWSRARETYNGLFAMNRIIDVAVLSAEVGLAKPDSRIFYLIAERLQVAHGDIILVDDSPANINAAQALGMHGVKFVNTQQTITEIMDLLSLMPGNNIQPESLFS